MDARTVSHILATPLAVDLLTTDPIGRFAYTGLDGDVRVIPIRFWTDGEHVVFATPVRAAKVAALRAHPRFALTVDRGTMPPKTLLLRGAARVEIVDGVPPAYLAGGRKIMEGEQLAEWEAGVQALFQQMAVISLVPDHAVLHDFETTIPKAVADLVAARH